MSHRVLGAPRRLVRFHFHESTLFNMAPQTSIINTVVLNNKSTQLIKRAHESSLQRSFDAVLHGHEGSLNDLEGVQLAKLYMKAYRPFMSKSLLDKYFHDPLMLQRLKQASWLHSSLHSGAADVIRMITKMNTADFGILRGDYFVSLGGLKGYSRMLNYTDSTLFKGHHKMNVNFTEPMSTMNPSMCEKSLEKYLKASARNNTHVKNYLVVNSPRDSEFFSSLASKFGTRIIVLTGMKFPRPSSTVESHLWEFESSRRRGDTRRCELVEQELGNMKFIAVKNMSELLTFISTIDPVSPSITQSSNPMPEFAFDERLKEMEFDIMGHSENEEPHLLF